MPLMQGKFKPRHPEKYRGDSTNIIYRSGWELKLMSYLDKHPGVLLWNSEEIVIPYRSPIDGKMHRYFPDFYVEMINKDNKKEKILIEVKPKYQCGPPVIKKKGSKPTKRYIREVKDWGINSAKWKAAEEYCIDRGIRFQLMHEDHLGIK
jgi:hypothetical protein